MVSGTFDEDLKEYPSFKNEVFDSSVLSINAIAYSRMKHEPNHPLVRASYGVFKSEMMRQLVKINENRLHILAASSEPYSDSRVNAQRP